ncbi:glycosyltransferase family 2 protein [Candidatus Dojkabacteria bacterium]|uniref:Glycosyltransferase family 2 protein n=1 Tax=Candidatus Dojkabacteria bacterium TaxID=2099670 RepID=A0A955RLY8_9BACT|nr:glycosyltransferase family 2 protein [Candidatus Dojkabacteria bacterium]
MSNYKKDFVDVITLNYNGKDSTAKLLDSFKDVGFKNYEIFIVDNGSSDGSADFLEKNYPEAKVIRSKKNLFFSRGNNLAISQTNSEFILLINNDIIVKPEFLSKMVERIKESDDIAAVASKMLLQDHPSMLDSVGVVMAKDGSPFNRGIGQPDVGQYDISEQTFGACFGCVLIRRDLYEGDIGPLDNQYFGYFEDVDWSFRANMLGYKIVTEPEAVVFHAHSVSSRKNVPMWKFYLIQRNFIWTIQKNFERKRAIKRTVRRYQYILKNMQFWPGKKDKLQLIKLIFVTLFTLPSTLLKRFNLQRRRKVWDEYIFRFSQNEYPFFEDINYKPVFTLDNLEHALKRIAGRDEKTRELHRRIISLNKEKEHNNNSNWDSEVKDLINDLVQNKVIDSSEKQNYIKDMVEDRIWDNS